VLPKKRRRSEVSASKENWQPDAVGRRDFNLKINVGSYHRSHSHRFSPPTFRRGTAMKLRRRGFLHLAAGVAAFPAVSRIARAQTYPSRPITIIVPYAAGGATDVSTHSQGRETSRFAGGAVHKNPAGHQPQDRQGAGP
jgi:hypothetical protein